MCDITLELAAERRDWKYVVTALQREGKRVQTPAEQREAEREERKQVSSAGGICVHWEKMSSPLRIISFNGSVGMNKISSNVPEPERCLNGCSCEYTSERRA